MRKATTPAGLLRELTELAMGAVIKAAEALDFGDQEEARALLGAAETNLGQALTVWRRAA